MEILAEKGENPIAIALKNNKHCAVVVIVILKINDVLQSTYSSIYLALSSDLQ